ncbi:MAG: TetR/AcrR family transcriptional regulator [Pseudomonadota bacterium]
MPEVEPCKAAGRPKASDIEARNLNLVQTAGHLFVEKGYSNVSLEMIAKAARVAVRTIYVKFGGKVGLFSAVLIARRGEFLSDVDAMERDQRPLREVVTDFAYKFHALITTPEAVTVQRMVIAEAKSNPELAQTFFDAGPRMTRELLSKYFARPDVQAQLREGVALELVPVHLLNSVMGDQFCRFMIDQPVRTCEEQRREIDARLDLFFHAVLRHPAM